MAESPKWRNAEKSILEMARRCYPSATERAALRGGLGDAACLCDAIANELLPADAAVAKLCADAIWTMRSKVQVTHD
jgi:hypothetical protein